MAVQVGVTTTIALLTRLSIEPPSGNVNFDGKSALLPPALVTMYLPVQQSTGFLGIAMLARE